MPVSDDPDVAKLALGGGGRYDGLLELVGGRPTPACGMGLGLERIVARMRAQDTELGSVPVTRDVFVAQLGEQSHKKAFASSKKSASPAFAWAKRSPRTSLMIDHP